MLNEAREHLASVAFASDEALDALTLVAAVSHVTDALTTAPRALVSAKVPAAGKTVLLETTLSLCRGGVSAAGATQEAIRATYRELGGSLTLGVDEISQVFGEDGSRTRLPILRDILTRGYRSTATIMHRQNGVGIDVPIFGVALMAGLRKAVPSDLATRCVRIEAVRKPDDLDLLDAQDPGVLAYGDAVRSALHTWLRRQAGDVRQIARDTTWRKVHPALVDRRREVWHGLFAVARVAGGDWPDRCRAAFSALALGEADGPVIGPRDQLVLDVGDVFDRAGVDRLLLVDLVALLRAVPDRPQYELATRDKIAKDLSRAFGGTAESMRATVLTGPDAGTAGRGWGWHLHQVEATVKATRAAIQPASVSDDGPDLFDVHPD